MCKSAKAVASSQHPRTRIIQRSAHPKCTVVSAITRGSTDCCHDFLCGDLEDTTKLPWQIKAAAEAPSEGSHAYESRTCMAVRLSSSILFKVVIIKSCRRIRPIVSLMLHTCLSDTRGGAKSYLQLLEGLVWHVEAVLGQDQNNLSVQEGWQVSGHADDLEAPSLGLEFPHARPDQHPVKGVIPKMSVCQILARPIVRVSANAGDKACKESRCLPEIENLFGETIYASNAAK